MLRTRVITALILVAILLPALFFTPQWAWGTLMAGMVAAAGWEWGAFMQLSARGRIGLGLLMSAVCVSLLGFLPEMLGAGGTLRTDLARPVLMLTLVFWVIVVPCWLRFKWPLGQGLVAFVVGFLVIVPTWVAILLLRLPGAFFLFGLMVAVWLADIGAYFFGKLLGRHKLAPSVSPGKTWEGAIGGGLVVLAYGLAVRHFLALDKFSIWAWVLVLLAVAAISVIGDLFESMLKRQVGLKDSSNALPGHGGVLDRIDSLTSVLPLVALLWLQGLPE